MKKIAIVCTPFVVGGIEKSLLDLLDFLKDKYKITVFLPSREGAWIQFLEEKVVVKYLDEQSVKALLWQELRDHNYFSLIKHLMLRSLCRIVGSDAKKWEYHYRGMSSVEEKFDCAIAYTMTNYDCILNCLYRINSSSKIAFVHNQVIDQKDNLFANLYDRFDRIFCVSEQVRMDFLKVYPFFKERTDVFHNVLNKNKICQMSEEPVEWPKAGAAMKILTVGRLSEVKGQLMIPAIAKMLRDNNRKFVWYLVGEGDLRESIEKEIVAHKVEDNVVLLGRSFLYNTNIGSSEKEG